jgi:hypothetical protein
MPVLFKPGLLEKHPDRERQRFSQLIIKYIINLNLNRLQTTFDNQMVYYEYEV